jgi:RNA polymerase sigma factor (TIGR02999 family)
MFDGDSKELTDKPPRDDARAGLDGMWPMVLDELKRVAHRRLGVERDGHTLCTTALVHEVYLRLADQRVVAWDDRGDFFSQAGRAMRRILVDYARRHRALRRGGGAVPISLNVDDSITSDVQRSPQIAVVERADEIVALDEALERFAELEPRAAHVVECRFFAGLTEDETAIALGVTPRTVARDWVKARAWLYRALNESSADAS